MVTAGRHDIEFSNEALGYRSTQTIQVAPGQVAKVKPDWPQGTIAINATPWATVTLDGGTQILSSNTPELVSDSTPIPPGSLRISRDDMKAIMPNLSAGMKVYFY